MCFMTKVPARGSRPSPPLQRRPSLSLSPPDDHSSSAPHFLHRDVGKFVHCEGEDRSEHLPRQFVLLDAESSKQHSHAFRRSLSASGLPRVSARVASSWRRDHSCIGSLLRVGVCPKTAIGLIMGLICWKFIRCEKGGQFASVNDALMRKRVKFRLKGWYLDSLSRHTLNDSCPCPRHPALAHTHASARDSYTKGSLAWLMRKCLGILEYPFIQSTSRIWESRGN